MRSCPKRRAFPLLNISRAFFQRRLPLLLGVLPLLLLALRGEAKTSLQILEAAPVTTAVLQRVSEAYLDPSRFDYGRGLKESLRAVEALVPEFQAKRTWWMPVAFFGGAAAFFVTRMIIEKWVSG